MVVVGLLVVVAIAAVAAAVDIAGVGDCGWLLVCWLLVVGGSASTVSVSGSVL